MRRRKIMYGFTLIEILVSLMIVGIFFSFGYVSFRDFSRRQAINGAAKVLQADIRLAQEQALSGQKPSGCGILDGIRFRVGTDSYFIEAVCGSVVLPIKSVELPTDISLSPTLASVQFNVLGNGNSIPAGQDILFTLTQNGSLNRAGVKVTSGGEIGLISLPKGVK